MIDTAIVIFSVTGSILLIVYQAYKRIVSDYHHWKLSLKDREAETLERVYGLEKMKYQSTFSAIPGQGHMIYVDHVTGRVQEFETSRPFAPPQNEQTIDSQMNYATSYLPPLMPILEKSLSIILYGQQGAGKTSLLCHLIELRHHSGERCIIIDAHGYDDKYPFGELYGAGRNYNEIDDILQWGIDEMNQRYSNYPGEFQPVSIFIDEATLLSENCGNFGKFVKCSLTEFRKISMRVVLCLHSRRAKFVDLKGSMDLLTGVDLVQLHYDRHTGERYAEVELSGKDEPQFFSLPGPYMGTRTHNKSGVHGGHTAESTRYTKDEKPIFYRAIDYVRDQVHGKTGTGTGTRQNIDPVHDKIISMYDQGASLNEIARTVYGNTGGKQNKKIKRVLKRYEKI
jgi:hypothetical protein